MSFLNLSLGELIGLAGAISAGMVALYLLDRSKRRQTVATLRFWVAADVRTELKHRRRIQQPWSLLLQILSIILLLVALAAPQWGGAEDSSRDHVVILDTSAWMGARTPQGMLIDQAKAQARAYIDALPRTDRVMIVRADALATPATAFESNRQKLYDAIRQSQPGASALNLEQALQFAERAQKLQSQRAGEIVFAGAGRVPEDQAALAQLPPNFRLLAVNPAAENVGLRKIGLRRSLESADTWDIFVAVHNYGARPHTIDLAIQIGNAPAGSKRLALQPGAEEQATFHYHTKAAGDLEARIAPGDAFPEDDRAVIELPADKPLRAVVYTSEPEAIKPLIASNPQVDAVFVPPANYDPQVKADVVVLDQFAPTVRPRADSIWIEPPAAGSPIPVRELKSAVRLERWRSDTALGAGLQTKDVQLDSAELFAPAKDDITVAEAQAGPLIVARDGSPRLVEIGFQPLRSSMKYELATPLLMANILRWLSPETFRSRDVQAGTVGTVTVPLDSGTGPASVRVITEDSRPLPFTIDGDQLRFFAGAPGTVRVIAGDHETVYSLTLPDVADAAWHPPANVRRGIPPPAVQIASAANLWPWFALLGGLGFLIDWLLFGRSRAFRLRAANMMARAPASWKKGAWKKLSWRRAS